MSPAEIGAWACETHTGFASLQEMAEEERSILDNARVDPPLVSFTSGRKARIHKIYSLVSTICTPSWPRLFDTPSRSPYLSASFQYPPIAYYSVQAAF